MDFKQIEAFVNVAKYKSFSKAADAIYLSQPTVSAHIMALEEELNVTLFERGGREVKLTHAGSVFLEYAINLINIRNSAIAGLTDYSTTIKGTLSISSSTTPCRYVLPSLIRSFYSKYSNLKFDIKEENTKNVVKMILSGVSDIGIVGEVIEDSKLTYTKIADDNLVLISNNKDLPSKINVDSIYDMVFIMREKGSATRNAFEKALINTGYSLSKLNIFAEVSSLEAVLQFVKFGLGVSITSRIACNDYIESGIIKEHEIEGLNLTRGIYAVVHNSRVLPPAANIFYNYITNNKNLI